MDIYGKLDINWLQNFDVQSGEVSKIMLTFMIKILDTCWCAIIQLYRPKLKIRKYR